MTTYSYIHLHLICSPNHNSRIRHSFLLAWLIGKREIVARIIGCEKRKYWVAVWCQVNQCHFSCKSVDNFHFCQTSFFFFIYILSRAVSEWEWHKFCDRGKAKKSKFGQSKCNLTYCMHRQTSTYMTWANWRCLLGEPRPLGHFCLSAEYATSLWERCFEYEPRLMSILRCNELVI